VKGYGIFPGTIDINTVSGAVDAWGTPVALSTAPGAAGTGLDTNTIVVEMGALYVDANKPPLSGTLLSVKVNGDCNVCVTGEPVRGNVVQTDANQATLSADPVCKLITSEPEYLDFGDANDSYKTLRASEGARHNPVGVTLGANRDTELDGVPTGQCNGDDNAGIDDENGVTFAGGRAVTVTVSGTCKLNAWVDFDCNGNFGGTGEQIRTNMNLPAAGSYPFVFVVPATATLDANLVSRWRVSEANLSAGYYYGYVDNGEVEDYNRPFISSCYNSPNDGNYANWNSTGRAMCWCYNRQCHGDADGVREGTSTLDGYWWVGSPDLDILSKGWLVKEPPKGSGVIGRVLTVGTRDIPLVCADFARNRDGTSTIDGYWWIGSPDLNKMSQYWLKKEPPKGSGTPTDCKPGNITRLQQPY